MERNPGEVFEAIYESGTTGLVGTLEIAINDNQNNVVFGPSTANIIELVVDGSPTGRYRCMLTAPAVIGEYTIHWSDTGTYSALAGGGVEELTVKDTQLDLPSLGGGVSDLLCTAWTTAEDVVDCCDAAVDSTGIIMDSAIVAASELLFLASGRQYPGACTATVRPCSTGCGCGYQVLSRGHLVGWDEDCWGGYQCGCSPESRVKLPGHVRSVTQVKIDGAILAASEYFVYENVYLVRKNGNRWPICQSMDLDDTEPGTFSVAYSYGKAPPVSAQLAARTLACELAKACDPSVECAIPNGVVQVTRNGITFTRAPLGRDPNGRWQTGMIEVDLFLNAVNPHGIMKQATVWGPSSSKRFARLAPE